MHTIFARLIAVIALALAPAQSFAAGAPQFAVGQEWTIRNSPIHIVIGRIEPMGRRTIIHVSLFHIPCPAGAGCQMIDAGHMPFDGEALANSVDKLVGTGAATSHNFEGGYQNWKDAHGGAFTLSVPEAANLIFKTVPPGSVR